MKRNKELLPPPTVSDLVQSDAWPILYVGKLTPAGVTVEVSYDGLKAGDKVNLYGAAPVGSGPSFDETKTVPEGGVSVSFAVGRDFFKGEVSGFQYFPLDESGNLVGASKSTLFLLK